MSGVSSTCKVVPSCKMSKDSVSGVAAPVPLLFLYEFVTSCTPTVDEPIVPDTVNEFRVSQILGVGSERRRRRRRRRRLRHCCLNVCQSQ